MQWVIILATYSSGASSKSSQLGKHHAISCTELAVTLSASPAQLWSPQAGVVLATAQRRVKLMMASGVVLPASFLRTFWSRIFIEMWIAFRSSASDLLAHALRTSISTIRMKIVSPLYIGNVQAFSDAHPTWGGGLILPTSNTMASYIVFITHTILLSGHSALYWSAIELV